MLRKIILLVAAGALAKKFLPGLAARNADTDAAPDRMPPENDIGHAPGDLIGDEHPDGSGRADPHFRPDPTGGVDASDRESLRPVTMPAPKDAPGIS